MHRRAAPAAGALLLLLLLCASLPVSRAGEPCEDGWAFDAGVRCVKRSDDVGPWGSTVCAAMRPGATLYVMESAKTQSGMGGMADHFGEFWVGMREVTTREGWVWPPPIPGAAEPPVDASRWPASRPDADTGERHCAFIAGGLASTPAECHYPDPQFPNGAPVICEAACTAKLPYVCAYPPAPPVGCDPGDVGWTRVSTTCYKAFPDKVEQAAANCRGPGGNAKANLAYFFDDDEAAAVRALLGAEVAAWVGAAKAAVIRPKRWEWVDPTASFKPAWFANRDTSDLGACAFIAGSHPQLNLTTNCSANTGELCPAMCDSSYRHLCQYDADTSKRDPTWSPEAYMAPVAPPTPTPTLTRSLSLTNSTSLTLTQSGSLTLSLTETDTSSYTVTPVVTPTEIPIDDGDLNWWWVLILVGLLSLLLALVYYLRRRLKNGKQYDWAKLMELEERLPREPVELMPEDDGHDSDPSDSDRSSGTSHEAVSPYTFAKGVQGRYVAPPDPRHLADDPYIEDWRPRVEALVAEFHMSPAQALQVLREHGGSLLDTQAGLREAESSRAWSAMPSRAEVAQQRAPYIEDDRRSV